MLNSMDLRIERLVYNSTTDTQSTQGFHFYGWYFNDKSVRTENINLDVRLDDKIYCGERGMVVEEINYLPTHLHIKGSKII